MKTLFMYRGLPGSGKSTHAKAVMAENPGAYKRVNKDDLRAMIDNGHWSRDNEKFVLYIRDIIIVEALKQGKHVICDDTNFGAKHEPRLKQLAHENGAAFEIVDLTHVSIETCIERDLKRLNSVGEAVIRKMYRDFLQPKPPVIEYNPELPDCYICDLDGTVALNDGHRGWYEWEKVLGDKPHTAVIDAFKGAVHLPRNSKVIPIYVSGRDSCHADTVQWMMIHGLPYGDLYMRQTGDQRDDTIVKEEIYRREIEGKFNVLAVWDDRRKVVDMWRDLGLTCFQVAPGEF
jgi:predicted kinase